MKSCGQVEGEVQRMLYFGISMRIDWIGPEDMGKGCA